MDTPTRRLDHPDEDVTRLCLRCGDLMISTRTWSDNGLNPKAPLAISLLDARNTIWRDIETTSAASLTCLTCGYTEIRATHLRRLRQLYAKEQ